MKLSEKIKDLRKQNEMSQEDLARKLNVSRQAVSRWENATALPDASNILQLSKIFSVSADFLLNDDYEQVSDLQTNVALPTSGRKKAFCIVAGCMSVIGLLGNFIFYVLSRFFKVMIPNVIRNGDEVSYHWSSDVTGYSYRYFIQTHKLEVLTIIFAILFFAGIIILLLQRDRTPKAHHSGVLITSITETEQNIELKEEDELPHKHPDRKAVDENKAENTDEVKMVNIYAEGEQEGRSLQ